MQIIQCEHSRWKYVSKEQAVQLLQIAGIDECRQTLSQILNLNVDKEPEKNAVRTDLFFYAFVCCKENKFNPEKVSVFLSILLDLFLEDIDVSFAHIFISPTILIISYGKLCIQTLY